MCVPFLELAVLLQELFVLLPHSDDNVVPAVLFIEPEHVHSVLVLVGHEDLVPLLPGLVELIFEVLYFHEPSAEFLVVGLLGDFVLLALLVEDGGEAVDLALEFPGVRPFVLEGPGDVVDLVLELLEDLEDPFLVPAQHLDLLGVALLDELDVVGEDPLVVVVHGPQLLDLPVVLLDLELHGVVDGCALGSSLRVEGVLQLLDQLLAPRQLLLQLGAAGDLGR